MQVLISLTTLNDDYQQEQASTAEAAARRLGIQIRIVYADLAPAAGNTRMSTGIQNSAPPAAYFPRMTNDMALLVRTTAESKGVASAIRRQIKDMVRVYQSLKFKLARNRFNKTSTLQRGVSTILGGFAAIATARFRSRNLDCAERQRCKLPSCSAVLCGMGRSNCLRRQRVRPPQESSGFGGGVIKHGRQPHDSRCWSKGGFIGDSESL